MTAIELFIETPHRLAAVIGMAVLLSLITSNPRLPIPLPLFYITASEVANDHDRVVIILGLADRRRALVNEFSGRAVNRVDLNLGMAAVLPDFRKPDCRSFSWRPEGHSPNRRPFKL